MIAPTPENKPPTVEEFLAMGFGKPETLSLVIPETPIEQNQVIGYGIQRGEKCILSAKPKCGKSSFLRQAIRMMDYGAKAPWGKDFGDIAKGRVLIVTEESAGIWAEWRDTLGMGNHIDLLRKQALRYQPWPLICEYIAALVREEHYALVVVDTLSMFAKLQNENDASECTAAMGATDCIVTENCALVLVHHDRKSGGSYGDSARGSGALMGCVDTAIQMGRAQKADQTNYGSQARYLRRFYVQSRHDYVPSGFALMRDREGYYKRVSDNPHAPKGPTASERQQAIVAKLLPEQGAGAGYTWEDVQKHWPTTDGPTPGESTIRKAMKAAEDAGLILSDGTPPHKCILRRYWRPSSVGPVEETATPRCQEATSKGTPKTAPTAQEPIEEEENTRYQQIEMRDGYPATSGNGDRDGAEMGAPNGQADGLAAMMAGMRGVGL